MTPIPMEICLKRYLAVNDSNDIIIHRQPSILISPYVVKVAVELKMAPVKPENFLSRERRKLDSNFRFYVFGVAVLKGPAARDERY